MKAIPKEIQLGGTIIKIVFDNDYCNKANVWGLAKYRTGEIILCTELEGDKMDSDTIERTLYHELVHWILHLNGEKEMGKDEAFVERFSNLLHQAVKQLK